HAVAAGLDGALRGAGVVRVARHRRARIARLTALLDAVAAHVVGPRAIALAAVAIVGVAVVALLAGAVDAAVAGGADLAGVGAAGARVVVAVVAFLAGIGMAVAIAQSRAAAADDLRIAGDGRRGGDDSRDVRGRAVRIVDHVDAVAGGDGAVHFGG